MGNGCNYAISIQEKYVSRQLMQVNFSQTQQALKRFLSCLQDASFLEVKSCTQQAYSKISEIYAPQTFLHIHDMCFVPE